MAEFLALLNSLLSGAGAAAKAAYGFIPKIALLVLAGVLAWFLFGASLEAAAERRRADGLKGERDAAIARVGACQAGQAALAAGIAAQNLATVDLALDAQRRTAAAERSLAAERAAGEAVRRRAETLAALRPRSCAEASDLIDQEAGR